MRTFDSITIGETAVFHHSLSQSDVDRFIDLTGDRNKLHFDQEYASRTQLRTPVAHGMLGASFISTIIGTKLPGDGALWFKQSLNFHDPARVGDRLTVRAEVVAKHEAIRAIDIKTEILNQNGCLLTDGVASVKLLESTHEPRTAPSLSTRKTALIVGASGSIGSEVARELALMGFDVAMHFNNNSGLLPDLKECIANESQVVIELRGDLSVPGEGARLASEASAALGGIEVLVNCTGAPIVKRNLQDLSWRHFHDDLNFFLRSYFELAREVIPQMRDRGSGKIISIGSMAVDQPVVGWLPYIAAKSSLVGFTRGLAAEVAPYGIQVNLVSPSLIESESLTNLSYKQLRLAAARTPLRRNATSSDVASVVAFLCTKGADFITGETIRVNGGQSMI